MEKELKAHMFDLMQKNGFARDCGCWRTYERAKRFIRDRITPLNYEQAVGYAAEYLGV